MPGADINLSSGAGIKDAPIETGTVNNGTTTTSSGTPLTAYLGAGLGLLQAYGTYKQNSQIHDTQGYEDLYENFGNQTYSGDFNSLIQQRKNAYLEKAPSWKDIRLMDSSAKFNSAIGSGMSGAIAGAGFGGWGAAIGSLIGIGASLFGSSRSDTKAKQKEAELKVLRDKALAENQRNFLAGVRNAEMQTDFQALSNLAAFGGELNTQGADFTNGLLHINNGGSHESNPYEGVPIGADAEGTPNLVEEGETIFNDYVFSNRIAVPKAIRDKYKLRGTKKLTFAEASKKLAKESEERPNDPISKRGLEASMNELMITQEMIRNRKYNNNDLNKFEIGGPLKPTEDDYYTPFWKRNIYDDTFIKPISNKEDKEDKEEKEKKEDKPKPRNTSLRYAPAVGLGLMTLTDALGLTNKPNYGNADTIIKLGKVASAHPPTVGWNPIGNYLNYTPFDTMFYGSQLAAQANANRRAIINNSNGNRMTAIAGLLGADYNYQKNLGNLYRQAEEYNLEQRQKVEDFNRATNMANSEGFMKAAMANQEAEMRARSLGLDAQMAGYKMREATRLAAEEDRAANLSGFINALGNIGRDNLVANQIDFAIATGNPIGKDERTRLGYKKGGYLKRKKRGLTY